MMGQSAVERPNEVVIWSAAGLLATLLGVGAAFSLWIVRHESDEARLVSAGVFLLGLGLALIGVASPRILTRAFLVVFAIALVAGFVLGSPSFAHLTA